MDEIQKLTESISLSPPSKDELQLLLSLIDLTSLEGKDNDQRISALCLDAIKYSTAAVCVYPSLVSVAKKRLKGTKIKVASVAGAFPSGQLPLKLRLGEAEFALTEGADEIDMVISRGKFLEGNHAAVFEEVSAFKNLCGTKTLKVILETGELQTPENIRRASEIAIEAGADLLKTSTGKIPVNATPEAVCTMLLAIKNSGKKTGIKPSGGISDGQTAIKYLRLTKAILGNEWLQPGLFRLGASRLAPHIYAQL